VAGPTAAAGGGTIDPRNPARPTPEVATVSDETDAIVLRTIRYAEADSVLALYTRERGRLAAIAKGARRPRSRLGGRLQPGVRARVTLHAGRGDLAVVRGAHVVEPHAGLWVAGYRLRAAGCVLEAALRVLEEREPNEDAYHLLCRTLGLLARAPVRAEPPRLDPVVLGSQCKLLVVAGIFPLLGRCALCGAGPPLVAFSARAGGALCRGCAAAGEAMAPEVARALAGLVGRPLAGAAEACPPAVAPAVERAVSQVLREHLGVTLRSAAPL
jgi:DNA repair protein RecO (recombination protein O)